MVQQPGANLQQVVLHHIADDAKLVKVAAAPLGAKWLLQNRMCSLM